jgi:hypothetical protein
LKQFGKYAIEGNLYTVKPVLRGHL